MSVHQSIDTSSVLPLNVNESVWSSGPSDVDESSDLLNATNEGRPINSSEYKDLISYGYFPKFSNDPNKMCPETSR